MSKFSEGQTVRVVLGDHASGDRPNLVGEVATVAMTFGSPIDGQLYGLPVGTDEERGYLNLWWFSEDELEPVEVAA